MSPETKNKRLKAIEKKMVLQSCKSIESLIKRLDNLKTNNVLDKWVLIKLLLLEMPLMETLNSDTKKQKQLLKKLRKTINKHAPSFDFSAYTTRRTLGTKNDRMG